jgi:aldehyde dehydrogenase (NAD+)
VKLHPNYVGGEWVRGAPAPNVNPSDTRDVVGDYDRASPQQAIAAIAAARLAQPLWAATSVQTRADVLQRVALEIAARRDELADLLAREEGKTLREARAEVVRASHIFNFFAGECVRGQGDALPSVRDSVDVTASREPVGVVALITPWNFPIAIPAWKIAPALAFGNAVVFKPAELACASAWALTEILARAGLPAGTFNLVNGSGALLGPVLTSAGVDAVSFTGSTAVGREIARAAVESRARVQLEMGGKNGLVVLDDADLPVAVQAALDGAFFATGQRCTASSRLIVADGIHDAFVETLTLAMAQQVVGDARHGATTIGPVVSEPQLSSDLEAIAAAIDVGAVLKVGGTLVEHAQPGFFLQPALFIETRSEMPINQEEVFGPVASVIRVRDYDDALSVANDVRFGLTAGICTNSLKHSTHFRRSAQAGMVMVNLPTAGVDYHVPFGGRKASSYGPREQGRAAIDFYTSTKTAYVYAA